MSIPPHPGDAERANPEGSAKGMVCTGAENPVLPPIQVETGKSVARISGRAGLGDAAAAKPLASPVILVRNNTPM